MAARPPLPTSSSDFALPPSTSTVGPGPPGEEFNPLLMRFRRPSLLAPPRATFYSEGRINSPLASSSFTTSSAHRHASTGSLSMSGEESESDREKMWTDSPPFTDSGSNTPSTPPVPCPSAVFAEKDKSTSSVDSDSSMKSNTGISSYSIETESTATVEPSTPSQPSSEVSQTPSRSKKSRRKSHPVSRNRFMPYTGVLTADATQIKVPRILTLLSESKPEENEVKSEAQFQKFVASFSTHPGIPRSLLDRGRYPDEAGDDEPVRDDPVSSDDEGDPGIAAPSSYSHPSTEPINIPKSVTPAQSVNGDDFGFSESPGTNAMDIDTFQQPSSACGSPKMTSWRYTPPPTATSAVRSNKRKMDDRYDPYPLPAKRRAVSPSVSYLRDSTPSLFAPRTPNGSGRIQLPHPIAIPVVPNSGASSPVVTPSGLNGSRPMSWGAQSVLSSPTLRAQIGLASPVLRPMMRRREDGREVEGAGEGVNGLSLE
ncbi:uncharacterized protein PHACADRAFT_24600 [Phanerochaete carnosa HHB-10118-sp]|uniref:Uncharacterized protein n=1 Tax=Phanerochaete carnosa (strain HHB-10118-sp) TaxID=650164 RepID=K5WBT9_PHACS|nr:uncharacterized protein PHACADRAFT_24600 [Phanerochaete carnosa HHB-10118-sp]EKM61398.1 hypothetical protein PHACADRAFT_24600 [Phanerochaete carnosa HHB-10118-sp]